jgi:hypothetical protein
MARVVLEFRQMGLHCSQRGQLASERESVKPLEHITRGKLRALGHDAPDLLT